MGDAEAMENVVTFAVENIVTFAVKNVVNGLQANDVVCCNQHLPAFSSYYIPLLQVLLPIGQFYVKGSIFMKSGVLLNGR